MRDRRKTKKLDSQSSVKIIKVSVMNGPRKRIGAGDISRVRLIALGDNLNVSGEGGRRCTQPVKLCRVFAEQLDAAVATMPTRKSLEDAVH